MEKSNKVPNGFGNVEVILGQGVRGGGKKSEFEMR